jgi:site-specific DNA recombinase
VGEQVPSPTPRNAGHTRRSPNLVAAWLEEVQAERANAESQLEREPPVEPLRRADLATQVRDQAALLARLRTADAVDKQRIYAELGIRMTYDPGPRRLIVSHQQKPCTTVRVRGGT